MNTQALMEHRQRAELCESVTLPGATVRAILDDALLVTVMEEALVEISKGRGTFDSDPLQHCQNCLHEAITLAKDALARRPA